MHAVNAGESTLGCLEFGDEGGQCGSELLLVDTGEITIIGLKSENISCRIRVKAICEVMKMSHQSVGQTDKQVDTEQCTD